MLNQELEKNKAKFYLELSEIYAEYKKELLSLGYKLLASEFHWNEKFKKVISFFNPKGKIILDVGCGDGKLLEMIKNAKICVGLDISKSQFWKNSPNLQFICGDCRFLPFKDRTFDIVVSTELIEHLHPEDAKIMLREINRILKDGGILVLTTPRKRSLSLLLVPIFTLIDLIYSLYNPKLRKIWSKKQKSRKELIDRYGIKEHIKEYTKKELISILENTGFKVLKSSGSTISPFLSPFVRTNQFTHIGFRFWMILNKILTNISEKFYGDIIIYCRKG